MDWDSARRESKYRDSSLDRKDYTREQRHSRKDSHERSSRQYDHERYRERNDDRYDSRRYSTKNSRADDEYDRRSSDKYHRRDYDKHDYSRHNRDYKRHEIEKKYSDSRDNGHRTYERREDRHRRRDRSISDEKSHPLPPEETFKSTSRPSQSLHPAKIDDFLPPGVLSSLNQIMDGSKSSTFVPSSVHAHVIIATAAASRKARLEILQRKSVSEGFRKALEELSNNKFSNPSFGFGGDLNDQVVAFQAFHSAENSQRTGQLSVAKAAALITVAAKLDETLPTPLSVAELASLDSIRANMMREVQISGLHSSVNGVWLLKQLNLEIQKQITDKPSPPDDSPFLKNWIQIPHNPEGKNSISGVWIASTNMQSGPMSAEATLMVPPSSNGNIIIRMRSQEEAAAIIAHSSMLFAGLEISFNRPRGVVSTCIADEQSCKEASASVRAYNLLLKSSSLSKSSTNSYANGRELLKDDRDIQALTPLAEAADNPPTRKVLIGVPSLSMSESAIRELLMAYGPLSAFWVLQKETPKFEDDLEPGSERIAQQGDDYLQGMVIIVEWTWTIHEQRAKKGLHAQLHVAAPANATPLGSTIEKAKDVIPGYIRLMDASHPLIANVVEELLEAHGRENTNCGMEDGEGTKKSIGSGLLGGIPLIQAIGHMQPSRVVCFTNLGSWAEWCDENTFHEIQGDVRIQLETYGNVVSIFFSRPLVNGETKQIEAEQSSHVGLTFVLFDKEISAMKARKCLDGVLFGGRRVTSFYFSYEKYMAKDFDSPQPYDGSKQ